MCSLQDDNHNTPEPPPLQGGGVMPSANQSPRSRLSNLWGGCGRAGGGHGVVREGPRPWEECTCPERLGTRGRPAAEAPARCPSPAAQGLLGQGKAGDRPPRKTCPCVQFPARGQTQITTIVPRADRAGRKVSGPRQSRDRQGREMLSKTGGWHCRKKQTTGGLHWQDGVPGAVPWRRAAGCAVQGAREAVGAWQARSPSGHYRPAAKREENSCVGRRAPPARKSAGAWGAAGKGARGLPHTAAFQPHLQLRSPPPSPTPLGARSPGRGGGGTGNPLPSDCQSRRPGDDAGRRAAYLGPRCGDSRQASAGRGAAPPRLGVSSGSRFCRTPSGAQSSQTGPDCSRRSRRRRCRRQRTPRGGWKPVSVQAG
ncbi:translation initiation factor IF-2-like [Microtus oregoni]|uniref:translation initiation factor IF-2-like n=1 Tax=Microtus oregoni TaxID=111838 RepID=UPI001BB1FE1C|nr:translation initiation factor IF-2-like [Microtus oregoni]